LGFYPSLFPPTKRPLANSYEVLNKKINIFFLANPKMFKSSYMVMPLVEQLKIRTQSFRLLGYRSAATKKKSYVLSIGAITGIAWWAISNSRPALTEPSEDIREPASMNMEKVLSGLADPNSRIAVRDKPTASLILSFAIYKACSVKWLVDMAPSIISYASAMHLTKPLNFIIRHTVFDQFLGGESSDDCKNTMVRLNNHGIGVILALSVETDVAEVQEIDKSHFSKEVNQKADQIMNATKQCVMSASTQPGSFIALKISALTSPLLLQKVTSILSQLYESFDQHASAQAMSQSQLCHVVAQHRGLINVEENVPEIVHNHNEIDIVEFKHSLLLHRPVVMNLLSGVLSEQDRQDWLQMLCRLNEICSLARSCGVKVLIDAEQSYLQLAIDQAAQVMEQQHNQLGNCPTIYNTCTCSKKSGAQLCYVLKL
jgi:proline dehydrogenase